MTIEKDNDKAQEVIFKERIELLIQEHHDVQEVRKAFKLFWEVVSDLGVIRASIVLGGYLNGKSSACFNINQLIAFWLVGAASFAESENEAWAYALDLMSELD